MIISRKANAEDNVKGHFWESRYKCQALLDEKALLTAMAYVDLNPVRAAMAETPEQSEHTSVRERIQGVEVNNKSVAAPSVSSEDTDGLRNEDQIQQLVEASLLPFDPTASLATSIPFIFTDYLELLDCVGSAVHPDKRGFIPETTPVILQRLGINLISFIEHSNQFLKRFGNTVGAPAKLIELAAARNARYLRGMAKSRELFGVR